jgi:hypothetical protein
MEPLSARACQAIEDGGWKEKREALGAAGLVFRNANLAKWGNPNLVKLRARWLFAKLPPPDIAT